MDRERVTYLVSEFKKKIRLAIQKKRYSDALEMLYSCVSLLCYTNPYYVDEELEESVRTIAKAVFPKANASVNREELEQNTILFYDGAGLDVRGLARIYLEDLVQDFRVCYVTYADREPEIPGILQTVREHGGEVSFLRRERPLGMVKQLDAVLRECHAGKFIFYSYPHDVVGPVLMQAYEGVLTRYVVNLTDHAYWLGARAIDKCIEFRDYGASISSEYRGIPREKIVKLPFYPKIVPQEFQGFPFPVKEGQQVVFSGGSLYKTFGEGNKYYEIVDYILASHSDVIFWYAGGGDDSELKKCMERYPGRVYHTPERPDLFQLLQHVSFYLSTYPICGGLMYQYAAAAGVEPVTLRRDDCNDGFLLHQDELHVIFDTMEELKQEIDRVLTDEVYRKARGEQMRSAVISPETFAENLRGILVSGESGQDIFYSHIDTEAFRANYLVGFTEEDMLWLCVRKETLPAMLRFLPRLAVRGILLKLHLKLSGKSRP